MLYDKKLFLIKIVQKREIKKPKKKAIKEKQKNQRNKKMRQNENKAKKCIKVIYQGNYEKKRFIQSFKHREEILKLKIKIKNLQ